MLDCVVCVGCVFVGVGSKYVRLWFVYKVCVCVCVCVCSFVCVTVCVLGRSVCLLVRV